MRTRSCAARGARRPPTGLEPQDGDHVVEKMRMNGFYETRLDILLRGLGADTARHHRARGRTCPSSTPRATARTRATRSSSPSDGTSTTGEEWQHAALELRDDERRDGRDLRRDQGGAGMSDVDRPRRAPGVRRRRLGRRRLGRDVRRAQPGDRRGHRRRPAHGRRARPAAPSRPPRPALPGWRGMLAKERARIMRRWADLMMDNQEALAALLTTEQGKPIAESRVEIAYAASFLEWFGEEAKRVYGDTIPTYMHDRRIVVTKEPVGVTVGITPWNFPAAMPTRKAAPALGAGLHDGAEARRADAAHRAGGHAPRRGGRPAAGRAEHRDRRRRRRAGHRQGDDVEPARAQARVHRLDRGRQAAHGAVRRAGEEGLARARRQRRVHRLRRRRPRGGDRGRADLQVPQLRADLHLGQPHLRPGPGLRRVRRRVHRARREAHRRRRLHRGRQRRAAHRRSRASRRSSATSATRASTAPSCCSAARRTSGAGSSSRPPCSPGSPTRWR